LWVAVVEGLQFRDQSRVDLGTEVVGVGHGRLQGPGLGQLVAQYAGREGIGITRGYGTNSDEGEDGSPVTVVSPSAGLDS
jgi:hypothetical protein